MKLQGVELLRYLVHYDDILPRKSNLRDWMTFSEGLHGVDLKPLKVLLYSLLRWAKLVHVN